ncbi:phage integrase N-terminal SAM-like domain-containing protein [Kribbella sp. NBC_00359]|uniref:phage integrase N-terminal SAM-like domain-containing protein n=1 Tax=Kribbella sp. NBC_00359 TaxID=2975966 RepID=UPI002E2257C2
MMLDGWRNQQLSRNLQFATIEQRPRHVQRFIDHVNEDPWNWTPGMVEEFSADLRAVRNVAHSTLRAYHSTLRAFTSYVSNPDYGLDRVCEQYFGTHPARACFDWNTTAHVQAYDSRRSKRPYTRDELDALFEHADKEVERIGTSGRKGWQAAYRDAVMIEDRPRVRPAVQRATPPGDRRLRLQPARPRFRRLRRVQGPLRQVQALLPYKGRSVLTVWRWTPGILKDWLANGRGDRGTLDLFTSERG